MAVTLDLSPSTLEGLSTDGVWRVRFVLDPRPGRSLQRERETEGESDGAHQHGVSSGRSS